MKTGIKNTIVLMGIMTCCMGLLSGCGDSSSSDTEEMVDTHRVTRKTLNAIKSDDFSVMEFDGSNDTTYQINLSEDYRFATTYDENTEITSYFVWNPTETNSIADERDGRKEGEYEKELQVAFETARDNALKEARKWNPFANKSDTEKRIAELESDVFVFDKDAYITPYHDDVIMYAYSGVDRVTPKDMMVNFEVKASIFTYYQNTLMASIPSMKSALWDTGGCPSYDREDIETKSYLLDKTNGDFFCYTFTSKSGEDLTTTYGALAYPKTYYGTFFVEKEPKEGSIRRWYAFVFTNNSIGEIIDKETYDSIFSQFSSSFGVNQFYTLYDKDNFAYEKETDFSKGKSYIQLETAFDETFEYYIIKDNKLILDDGESK